MIPANVFVTENAFMPTLAGYQLREEVYRDAHIAVYRGCRDDGALVIVKLLHAEYPALEELARLRHEYETTKNLPLEGIVRPLALEAFGNGLALVLKDSGGQPLPAFLAANTVDVAKRCSMWRTFAKAARWNSIDRPRKRRNTI